MTALIYTINNDIPWLDNVVYFYMWLGVGMMTFLSFFVFNSDVRKAMEENVSTKDLFIFNILSDVAFILVLASLGNFVLAGLWAYSSLVVNSVRKEILYGKA